MLDWSTALFHLILSKKAKRVRTRVKKVGLIKVYTHADRISRKKVTAGLERYDLSPVYAEMVFNLNSMYKLVVFMVYKSKKCTVGKCRTISAYYSESQKT